MVDVTKSDTKPWVVKTNPSTGARPRELFAGLEEDAREFVERNFPRIHVEPGQLPATEGQPHDVLLNAPDGKAVHAYDGKAWTEVTEKTETPNESENPDGSGAPLPPA